MCWALLFMPVSFTLLCGVFPRQQPADIMAGIDAVCHVVAFPLRQPCLCGAHLTYLQSG